MALPWDCGVTTMEKNYKCFKWCYHRCQCRSQQIMRRVVPSDGSSPSIQQIREVSGTYLLAKHSRCLYTALWLFMVLLHTLSAAFLAACCKLYLLMENEYLDYLANLLAPRHDRHFRVLSYMLGGLGTVHGLQLVIHLGASVIARKLTTRPLKLGVAMMHIVRLVLDKLNRLRYCALTKATRTEIGEQRARWLRSQTENADDEAYCRTFAFRKTVEIATQIPNAYLYSTLVARPWINHTKVALVVVNCWSAFITHKMLMKRNRGTSTESQQAIRFFAVVVNALLATATSILLPSAIFMPYALQFDLRDLTFPSSLLYGDAEFPNLVLENRAFFLMSWANAAMKLVPHVSVVLCLEGIASMLHVSYHSDLATDDTITSVHAIESIYKQHIVATGSDRALTSVPCIAARASRRLYRVMHILTPLLFLTTGGIVLFVHLTAQYSDIKGDIDVIEGMCVQRMHPWFASNFSCATVKFNCYREGVVSPSQESLSGLEREAVRKIIFMHCPAFSMPPIIREFSFLMGIELWNTTLVAWGEESAISAQLHNNLLFVNFAYVNMTGIPPGLLQTPLPQRLTDLEFTLTNLTDLPDEIAKSWIDVEIVFIEHSLINPFPSVLMQLPILSELSLIDNKFDSIPDDALVNAASTYFYNLALSHNALRRLPQARAENFDVTYMALEFTLLTELPAWVYTNVWDSVSLGGSPLCEANNTAKLPEFAHCGENERAWDPLGSERFPTDLIKPFRTLNG